MSTTTPTPLDRVRWLPYVNCEEEDAPAGACLAIVDVAVEEGQAVLQCGQFAGAGPVAFNGLQQVAAGSPGQCTQDYPALAAYDSSATPATGDTWIPTTGQWSLTKGSAGAANGFIVIGSIDTDAQTMWVVPANTSGATVVAVVDTDMVPAGTPSNPYGQAVWAGIVISVQTNAATFANDAGGNRFAPDPLPSAGDQTCWILDLDSLAGSGAPNPTLMKGEFYIGIPCGAYAVGDVTLPLYAVRKGQQSDVVQITTVNSPVGGGDSSTAGQTVIANGSQLFDVQVQNYTPETSTFADSPFTAGVSAWLYFVDVPGGSQGTTRPTAICGDNYEATLLGIYDPFPPDDEEDDGGDEGDQEGGENEDDGYAEDESDPRPLYMCRSVAVNSSFLCQLASDLPAASIYSGSGMSAEWTPGSQTATLFVFDPVAGTIAAASGPVTFTVYNSTMAPVKALYSDGVTSKLLQGKYINGVAWIDVEGCS